jgi:hypothetical protein
MTVAGANGCYNGIGHLVRMDLPQTESYNRHFAIGAN